MELCFPLLNLLPDIQVVLKLIHASFTYHDRHICFKCYNHLWPHTPTCPSCRDWCWTKHPLETSVGQTFISPLLPHMLQAVPVWSWSGSSAVYSILNTNSHNLSSESCADFPLLRFTGCFGLDEALSPLAAFSSRSHCRLWMRGTKDSSGQVERSRTVLTKTFLWAPATLYLPGPSPPKCSTGKQHHLSLAGKILTALTEEGGHEDRRESLSSGNYKRTHGHASGTGPRPVYKRSSRS